MGQRSKDLGNLNCRAMKIILCLLICTVAQASWPSKEAVAVPCGTILDLNEFEEPDVEFTTIKGITGTCYFLITAPEGFHVELKCEGGAATANDQDASNFQGAQPVKIKFTPESEDSQLFCRVGTEEEHADYWALQGEDGSDTNIKQFDMAFDVHGESEGFRAPILAENEEKIKAINADPSRTWMLESQAWQTRPLKRLCNSLQVSLPLQAKRTRI